MIMGIISLIIFIVGIFLFFSKNNEDLFYLGVTMSFIGMSGLITFIGINLDTIVSWFKI